MDRRKFQRYRLIVTMIIAVLVGWSVTGEVNVFIPLLGIGTGATVLYLLKRQVKEVMEDERSHHIDEQAARTAVGIFAPAAVLVALVLIVLSNSVLPGYKQAGIVLAYSGCALMVLYHIAHLYHNRKH